MKISIILSRLILLQATVCFSLGALNSRAQSASPAPMSGSAEKSLHTGDSTTETNRGHSDNTALMPVPKLEQDSYDWYARHQAVLEIQNVLHPDIVLIGDSITHFWGGEPKANHINGPLAWDKVFGGKRVLNLGFGWDRTQNVLWRLDHGQMDGLTPKIIVLNIGTNNLTGTKNARTNTPEEVVEAIALICRKLHAKSPGSRILVMGIFPRGAEPDAILRAPIKAINGLLPAALKDIPQTSFLDIGDKFLNPDASLIRDLMPDTTHPSDKGYLIWAQALLDAGV